jgi:hypothetical protein
MTATRPEDDAFENLAQSIRELAEALDEKGGDLTPAEARLLINLRATLSDWQAEA